MTKEWVVMFDNEGLDTILPWSDIMENNTIAKLSGKDTPTNTRNVIARTVMRARLNSHRNAEVWGFTTDEDLEFDEMVKFWQNDNIDPLKDLVRSRGNKLY